MRKSDYFPDRPLGLLIAAASFFALLLSGTTLALLIAAGSAGRTELANQSDRLEKLGASRLLLEHLDWFLIVIATLSLLGVIKGTAIYSGTRRGFIFGIAVNLIAFAALLPWLSWNNIVLALANAAVLAIVTGALAFYCVQRLRGQIGHTPPG